MPSQSPFQLRAVILHPAPDGCVIDIETALLQQLFNIAQRQRIAKIPPHRTEYEAGFGLTSFEDRGSGYHFAILSRHQQATLKVATHPLRGISLHRVRESWRARCTSLLSLTEAVSEVAVSQDVFRVGGFHFAFFAELSNKNP